jgi:transposase-like protein
MTDGSSTFKQEIVMAKNSKSAIIREYLAKNPDAVAKDVAKQFGVTPNLVYLLKAKARAKVRHARREIVVATGIDLAALVEIKTLAEKVGGMKMLKAFVDVLVE